MTVKGIAIKNVYYMLSYAFKALRQGVYERVERESFEHAEELFAGILAIGLGYVTKRGLHRSYEARVDDLKVLRGRIDLGRTIGLVAARRQAISCRYDEFSVNNSFNQVLKTTALLLLRSGSAMKNAATLKRALLPLGEVDEIDLRRFRWSSLRFERNNQHYLMLINVCRMVAEGLLMTEGRRDGSNAFRKFELDEKVMASLYEAFIREYYARHYKLGARAAQIDWAIGNDDDGSLLPRMQSDITLSDEHHKLIIDAKFYTRTLQDHFGKYSVHSHNLYQILAYVNNEQANDRDREVGGMLLYAKTDEAAQPNVDVTIGGRRVQVCTLDLSQPFEKISQQLDAVVADYFKGALRYV